MYQQMLNQKRHLSLKEIKKRRRKRRIRLIFRYLILILILATIIFFGVKLVKFIGGSFSENEKTLNVKILDMPDFVDVQLINSPARSREKITEINDIVIHYVGNPGTTAQNNRNYFNQKNTEVCSHFVVGLDGEIIQCLPINEKSAASNDRNGDTISIEVCHEDSTGKFNEDTYNALVKLTAWLCENSGLDESHIIRHYDITGKECPLYYVRNEDEWYSFKKAVKEKLVSME